MNSLRVPLCVSAVLLAGLLLPTTPGGGGSEARAAVVKKTQSAKRHHSHVKASLARLRGARHELTRAKANFGGLRDKALQHINTAIKDLTKLEKHLRRKKK